MSQKTPASLTLVLAGLIAAVSSWLPGPTFAPATVRAFGALNSDEAVAVWQHRNLPDAPSGWDPWYSVLGRPNSGDATTSLTWHATGGPVAEAAPIATLAGDDKNPHVSTLAGSTPGTLSAFTTAVWQHAPGTGSTPGDWDIYHSTLNADGSWTAPAAIASLSGDDYDPNVAVAPNGNALAVWVHRVGVNDRSARTMYYSVRTAGVWSAPAAIGPSNGEVSIPEVTLTSVSSDGALGSLAVAVWTDRTALVPLTNQMFYSIFNGVSWTAPAQIPTEMPIPIIVDVGHIEYVGTDADPYGAFGRHGITADGLGNAYVVWSGPPQQLVNAPTPGVVGAILDVTVNTWTPMLTPFGSRFIGLGSENPDLAMTTATGDFDTVFDFGGSIEDAFRTEGAFTPESLAWDSELTDFRPSNAALSPTEMVGVNYGATGFLAFSPDEASDIIFSIGSVTPGVDVAWTLAAPIVPEGLAGEDFFPEVSSAFAATLGSPASQLTLTPAVAENSAGTPHTLTATVTRGGAALNGITVNFTVSPSGGSTPTPTSRACLTGTTGPGQCSFTYTSATPGTDTIAASALVNWNTLRATATEVWVAREAQYGRITGGALFDDGTVRVTYGFQLHCDAAVLPNSFQVNWKDPATGRQRKFHMPNDEMRAASCDNDPTITPDPPPGDPLANDTHEGFGTGRLDGRSGGTATWVLKDAGEPGGSQQGGADFVRLRIDDPAGNPVLSIDGTILRGNHQYHHDR